MQKTDTADTLFGFAVILGTIAFVFAAAIREWDVDKIISTVVAGSILFVPTSAILCLAFCLLLAPFASVFSVATRKKS